MPARITPKREVRLYLVEWREHRKLTQKQIAERLGCDVMTVSRWELHKVAVSTDTLAALAEALGEDMEPVDLFYHPNATRADAMLRDQPQEVIDLALKLIGVIRR